MAAHRPDNRPNAARDHVPVMLAEVIDALAPGDGEVFVDGTFGGGSYSRAILDAADCAVWAIDRDSDAIAHGHRIAADYPGRLTVLAGRFGDMDRLLAAHGIESVDGVVLDLGVSSMQIDDPARGFSFQADGPLDMRMGGDGATAADVVNELPEDALADIIFEYGEERFARTIARAIVTSRAEAPIRTTAALADVVRRAVRRRAGPTAGKRDKIDPATRTFQALRIHVNDELGEIARGLAAAERILRPGGRLVVVAFHSLEDRSVKSFLSVRCGSRARPSRHQPSLSSRGTAREAAPTFRLIRRGVLKPRAAEIDANPRARSARLRAAIRTDAPLDVAA
ncbi:MAG: 16S rRNA (cytosine(1402)-N(4))-methyltransferase RsmH [Alphaproteobacteria bacterium]